MNQLFAPKKTSTSRSGFDSSFQEAIRYASPPDERQPFTISAVFQEVVAIIRLKAWEKNLDIDLRLDESASEELIGVTYPLRQVVTDLILNALRFTRKGSVAVSARRLLVCDMPVHRLEYLFFFGENGLELARQDAKRLFRPSARPDAAEDRKYGGSGFGLAVAKKIVELMDGKTYVLDAPGGGLVVGFSAAFTKNISDRSAAPALPTTEKTSRLQGKRILLAEDNEAYRILLSHLLKKRELVPTAVSDGRAAVEEVRKQPFDLILMDARMPRLDGLEATRSIRQLALERMPIVAMVGFARRDERERCLEADMDDVLEKPVDSADLRRVLETWLLDPAARTR